MGIVIGFISFVAWGYTLIGAAGAYGLGIRLSELPQWWYAASVVAVITLIICIVCCVRDIRRMPGYDPRRMGVIRYDGEKWVCVREDDKRDQ